MPPAVADLFFALHDASLPPLVHLQFQLHGQLPFTVAGTAVPTSHNPSAFTAPADEYVLLCASPQTPSVPPFAFCSAEQSTLAFPTLHFRYHGHGP